MRQLTYFFILFCSLCFNTEGWTANDISIEDYISKYSSIAQSESVENNIPASIILAQAILESGFGNSDLCKRSNNHFGIKWKKAGDGEFVYSLDDDYDKNGKHVPSKFRKYSSAKESFSHHSQFLKNKEDYKSLFKYTRMDFVSWAYGLKACGYSTDKDYGVKLIKLIRRYKLDKYDKASLKAHLPDELLAESTSTKRQMKTGQNIVNKTLFNVYIQAQQQLIARSITEDTSVGIKDEVVKTNVKDSDNSFNTESSPLSNSLPEQKRHRELLFDNRHFSHE